MNVAPTVFAASIVTEHVGPVQTAPVHATSAYPVSGVATRLTTVPALNAAAAHRPAHPQLRSRQRPSPSRSPARDRSSGCTAG